jgi:hypothetical protein
MKLFTLDPDESELLSAEQLFPTTYQNEGYQIKHLGSGGWLRWCYDLA